MAKTELKILDPQILNRGTNESPIQMTYGDTDSPIVIDTETAFIECEAQGKSASIKEWVVDFEKHKMKLADEATDGNYHEIDFATATAMVGQLVMKVGIPTLQALLATLTVAYGEFGDGDSGGKTSENDAPTEKSPEPPKSPKLPHPFVPDEV